MKIAKSYIELSRAVRSAHRSVSGRVTRTRKGGILYRARVLLKESFRTKVEEGSGTACWSFKARANEIKFFTGIKSMLGKVWSDPKVYRHEIGHALYSPRGKKFFARVKEEGIPFRLWNLFEDCRIEYKLWDNFKDLGLFYWHKYIEIGKEITCPTNALLELKMRDSGARVSRAKTLKIERFFPAPGKIKFDLKGKSYKWHRATISSFYSRSVCLLDKDQDGMIKLLQDWIKIYGKEVEGGSGFAEDAPFSEDEIGSSEEYAEDGDAEPEETTEEDKSGSVDKDKSGSPKGLEHFKTQPYIDSGAQSLGLDSLPRRSEGEESSMLKERCKDLPTASGAQSQAMVKGEFISSSICRARWDTIIRRGSDKSHPALLSSGTQGLSSSGLSLLREMESGGNALPICRRHLPRLSLGSFLMEAPR